MGGTAGMNTEEARVKTSARQGREATETTSGE